MYAQKQEEQTSFNLKKSVVVGLFAILALAGLMNSYGIDTFSAIISSIFHAIIDYVVLIFVVFLLLTIFSAPIWVKRLFSYGGK